MNDHMSTLQNLTALGVRDEEIRKGEVVELDELDLKSAKKEKWSLVTNAEDSSDVIAAYAGDLAETLRENDALLVERDELEQNVNHLSQENGQLTQAMQTGQVVDQRIDELTRLMDDMEAEVNTLTERKQKDDGELDQLRTLVDQLRETNQQLESSLADERLAREEIDDKVRMLEEQISLKNEQVDVMDEQIQQYDDMWRQLEADVNDVLGAFYKQLQDAGIEFKSE